MTSATDCRRHRYGPSRDLLLRKRRLRQGIFSASRRSPSSVGFAFCWPSVSAGRTGLVTDHIFNLLFLFTTEGVIGPDSNEATKPRQGMANLKFYTNLNDKNN